MSNLTNFYTNLMTIQVTVFGIITAALFVLVQISHGTSHRHSLRLFKDPVLKAYFFISALTLSLTSLGALLLSLPKHDFFPWWNVNVRGLLVSALTPSLCLLLTGVSTLLFLYFLYHNIQHLHPKRILLRSARAITPEEVRLYLVKEYGLDPPRIPLQFETVSTDVLIRLQKIAEEGGHEPSQEDLAALAEAKRKSQLEYMDDQLYYAELREKAELTTDPLELIAAVSIGAIKSIDLQILIEVPRTIREISTSFLYSIKPSPENRWSPGPALLNMWTIHIISFVTRQLEVARKENLPSMELDILRTTDDYANLLLDRGHEQQIIKLMRFWKQLAYEAIGKNKTLFIWVINKYVTYGEVSLEQGRKDISDETFRHLGWLGENILDRMGIGVKPIMSDHDHTTESEELINTLLSFGSRYSSKYSSVYPLIYFDALYVILLKLIKLRIEMRENYDLKNTLYACVSTIASFVEPALRASNADGAGLAVMRIGQCYEELVNQNLDDSAGDVVDLLVSSAVSAVQFESATRIVPEGIEEHVSKLLSTSPFDIKITVAVREAVIKSVGTEYQKVWGFAVRLGKRMGTNFGFMFDWKTGERYTENDPRRH